MRSRQRFEGSLGGGGGETIGWREEKQWALKTLDAARGQLMDIRVATQADGTYALTVWPWERG